MVSLNVLGFHMTPVLILASPLPFQVPVCGLRNSQGPTKALENCTHVGVLEKVPGSWFRISAAPAIAVTWGMNHRMKIFLTVSSLSVYLILQ